MRPTIENFIALAILLGTGAWLLDGLSQGRFEYEPAIAFVAALGGIFAKDPIKRHFGWGTASTEHDRALFDKFLAVLPPDPAVRFIKQQDFGDSFVWRRLDPLVTFVETWDSVDTEFIDPHIQARKESLFGTASTFVTELARRTAPTRNTGFVSVYPDSLRAIGQGRPASVLEDAKVLNSLAREFVPKYEDFVRYCKGRLAQ